VSRLAERTGIREGNGPELAELKRDVAPEAVLDIIEQRSAQSG
jgi:hypothetical protein